MCVTMIKAKVPRSEQPTEDHEWAVFMSVPYVTPKAMRMSTVSGLLPEAMWMSKGHAELDMHC